MSESPANTRGAITETKTATVFILQVRGIVPDEDKEPATTTVIRQRM